MCKKACKGKAGTSTKCTRLQGQGQRQGTRRARARQGEERGEGKGKRGKAVCGKVKWWQ